MFLVGLTGGIASGKSVTSRVFCELGVEVIDADAVAKQVVEPGKKAWKKIKDEFGGEIIKPSGEIDRQKLGEIVFSDATKRRRLEAITHPEIYKQMFWNVMLCFFRGHQFVLLDLPLLFETRAMSDYIHKTIVVSCDPEQQLERLMKRNNLPENEAKKRIAAQMPLIEKCEKANFVIDNSRSLEETTSQILAVYSVLRHSKRHWRLRAIVILWFIIGISLILWFVSHLTK